MPLANVFRIAELRARLAYTLALARGLPPRHLHQHARAWTAPRSDSVMAQQKNGPAGALFNLFSGGGLEQMSIFGLGIMPYVSASIIMQLLAVVVPTLERLQKEGAAGRQKLNQYTRYGSIAISIVQGVGIARALASAGRSTNGRGDLRKLQ